ncbi:MAG: helix-turn-helix domain-containing protein [Alphaproteobacteria bacterium]|nr:helix-turn-helix domain-containing protein [Alphaproteobacteria bacterium]
MRKKNVTISKLVELFEVSNHTVVKARRTSICKCILNTLEKISNVLECEIKDLFEQEKKKK